MESVSLERNSSLSYCSKSNTIMNRKEIFILGMKIWWVINIVWLFIFAAGAIFIGVREVDYAGVVQTPEVRMVSFIVLGIAFLIVALFQLILLIFIHFVKKGTTNNSTKRLS